MAVLALPLRAVIGAPAGLRCCVLALQQHACTAGRLRCIPNVPARLNNIYALLENPLGNGRGVTYHRSSLKHLWA